MTIAEAATVALERIGRPAGIEEIYSKIVELSLYEFNTPVPQHVLRTQLRRQTVDVGRSDEQKEKLFRLVGDEKYDLLLPEKKEKHVLGMRRIHRAKDKDRIIAKLLDKESGSFQEIWRVLIFAALLGYSRGRRETLAEVDSGRGIDQSSFGNCAAWPGLLYLLALAESDSAEAMAATDEAERQRLAAFEEYANGGLTILRDELPDLDVGGLARVLLPQERSEKATPDLDIEL